MANGLDIFLQNEGSLARILGKFFPLKWVIKYSNYHRISMTLTDDPEK